MDKIIKIKNLIKKECDEIGGAPDWFYENHLLLVEKFSKELLKKLPKADKEIVLLGVWLHDLQRVRGIKGDHQKAGAREAGKVLREFGYPEKIIKKVQGIILTHSANRSAPKTLEGKILATADAMTHYYNDFFLRIALLGGRGLKEYKEWALEKLNRNYNKKIFFSFAKKKIKKRHDLFKKFFILK